MKIFQAATLVLTVAAAVPAQSKTLEISLDGGCDVFQITENRGELAAIEDSQTCATIIGVGHISRVKGRKVAEMALINTQNASPIVYDFDYPFKTGGEWHAIYSVNGVDVHDGGDGTYTVVK